MNWYSALSRDEDLVTASRDLVASVREGLQGADPNLLVLFVSDDHEASYREVAALLGSEFPTALLLGCSAASVIGGGEEVEDGAAISLTAAHLPGVSLTPFHLEVGDLPEPPGAADFWSERLGISSGEDPEFLLLADPFSFDVEVLVRGLDCAYPRGTKLGGIASGGGAPGESALYLGSEVHRSGAVGIALTGNLAIEIVVAQGCRPIGEPMFVTRCRDNLLFELDGKKALDVIQELYDTLDDDDQELCRGSLFLGLGMEENRGQYEQGDFLVRNLVGTDSESGALVVGGLLSDQQIVQFHLRDARTSAADLEQRLRSAEKPAPPIGALLFSCLGRGRHLYGHVNHDSAALREHVGPIPVGGFFGNGEIGPVAGRTFLHGYTSVFGLFRSRDS